MIARCIARQQGEESHLQTSRGHEAAESVGIVDSAEPPREGHHPLPPGYLVSDELAPGAFPA